MFFARPSMLMFALTALPIIAFYMIRARRRRVTVATLMFWDRALQQQGTQRRLSRLHDLPSLFVQLFLLGILVAALADPWWGSAAQTVQRTALVIDTSASMQAVEGGYSRFARALERARGLASTARDDHQMAVVLAGSCPTLACGMTGEPALLARALGQVRATDGIADMQAALRRARSMPNPPDHLVVLTDGSDDAMDALWDDAAVSPEIVGQTTANTAITNFEVRRNFTALSQFEALVELTNFSDQPADVRLDVTLGAGPVDSIPVVLRPGQVWQQTISGESVAGGILAARIPAGDALALDDTAQAVLSSHKVIPVTLVSPSPHYLERVLQATGVVELTVRSAVPERAPPGGLLVIHDSPIRTVPEGNVIVIHPVGSSDAWTHQGDIEFPTVGPAESNGPLMNSVDFGGLRIPAAALIAPRQSAEVLAATDAGQGLLYTMHSNRGRMLLLTVDILQSDLPLRTVFPILFANSLNWFLPQTGDTPGAVAAAQQIPLSAFAVSDEPQQNHTWRLHAPDGSATDLPPRAGSYELGPFSQTGIWSIHSHSVTGQGSPTLLRQFACNLSSPQESDLRVAERAGPSPRTETETLTSRPIWRPLLAGLLLLVSVEWQLYHKHLL